MTYCIVYLSASRTLMEDGELQSVLAQSRRNNAAADITGVLLYCNGSVIQVLEGEQEAVTALFEKIKFDYRHSQVIVLYKGNVDSRSFDKWAMGYITMEDRNMEELKDQLSFIENPYDSSTRENKILSLVKTFFKNNYRN
ncbi:BLUF domain-containing protein [Dyadobacter luticola]|uniref:BLUF domain-containing protein n=1 Tax=Dyadobacter luticola TaxID=1979387 RepID=A0A5R9L6X3_9BACT|nr:BLUF domain-containing protein [Dyadobacter luticola]TLV03985.1 BLUF domain-containing protein [Dyadobacter luticola]